MSAGPFRTERQATDAAREHPAWTGPTAALNHQILREALDEAGVELGAWDRRIIEWLAMWEPSTCAVIAGLITRAHQPARAAAGKEVGP
jgi:hypothetical protein